nr:protein CTR9 homolog [Tanacetum cinerariifolium]
MTIWSAAATLGCGGFATLGHDPMLELSIWICDAVNDKNPDALCMLGHLELKNDDWVKAKDTFRASKDASNEKETYVTLCLGNWNYFTAVRKEHPSWKRRISKIKGIIHKEHPANMYVANGAGVVLAEKAFLNLYSALETKPYRTKNPDLTSNREEQRTY